MAPVLEVKGRTLIPADFEFCHVMLLTVKADHPHKSTLTAECVLRKVSECTWCPVVSEGLMSVRASAQFLGCSSWKEQLTHYVSFSDVWFSLLLF